MTEAEEREEKLGETQKAFQELQNAKKPDVFAGGRVLKRSRSKKTSNVTNVVNISQFPAAAAFDQVLALIESNLESAIAALRLLKAEREKKKK